MAELYNPDEENDSNIIDNMEIDEDTDQENSPVVDSARVSRNIDLNSGRDSVQKTGGETWLLIGDENSESKEWNWTEIEGLFCPICMDAWTDDGDHHISHIYGLSCIRKWLNQERSSGQCPQCNMKCSLKDVRKLFAPRIAAVDNESQKIIRSLEVKCFVLEKKNADSSRKESELRKYNAELQDRVTQLIEERLQAADKLLWEQHHKVKQLTETIRSLEVKCAFLETKNADLSRKESELRKYNAELQDRFKQLIEEQLQLEDKQHHNVMQLMEEWHQVADKLLWEQHHNVKQLIEIQSLEDKCAFLEKKNADSSRKESEWRKSEAELNHKVKQLTERTSYLEHLFRRLTEQINYF